MEADWISHTVSPRHSVAHFVSVSRSFLLPISSYAWQQQWTVSHCNRLRYSRCLHAVVVL